MLLLRIQIPQTHIQNNKKKQTKMERNKRKKPHAKYKWNLDPFALICIRPKNQNNTKKS